MEYKYENIKNVILEFREDGKAAILFERENGVRISLMVPPIDDLSPDETTALWLKEV